MASIAYVSDGNMLEFHRMNGSQQAVFWRVSTKKFSSFKPGDLLFFLAKGTETKRRREKGVVGYGVFVDEKTISIDGLWRRYKEQTGYPSKADLTAAIRKTTKNEQLPRQISRLALKDMIFFQGPIYLSEIGIRLPGNLESFTYLDAHEGHVTLELLQKVKEVGIDSWSAAMNGKDLSTESFDHEILRCQVASIYESAHIQTIHRSLTFQKKCFNSFRKDGAVWVNDDLNSFLVYGHPTELYYLYTTTQRENRENFLVLLGQLVFIDNSLRRTVGEDIPIHILTDVPFNDVQKEALLDQKFRIDTVRYNS